MQALQIILLKSYPNFKQHFKLIHHITVEKSNNDLLQRGQEKSRCNIKCLSFLKQFFKEGIFKTNSSYQWHGNIHIFMYTTHPPDSKTYFVPTISFTVTEMLGSHGISTHFQKKRCGSKQKPSLFWYTKFLIWFPQLHTDC